MHTYIVGITNSGKSHLAKHLAREYKAAGFSIIVLDPQGSREWAEIADTYTEDRDEFLDVFWRSRNCKVFVDECQDVMDDHDKEMAKIVKRGRHNGHQVFLISQRPKSIPRNARTQCSQIISFKQARDEARTMASEIGNDDFVIAGELGRYEFVQGDNFTVSVQKL